MRIKEILSVLLLVVIGAVVPVQAFEVDGINYQGLFGDSVASVSYFGSDYTQPDYSGDIIIPEWVTVEVYGNTYVFKVTGIGMCAFYNCVDLKSVSIPNTVTEILNWAFYCCESLQAIAIPNSVVTVSEYAFADCKSLKDVVIGNSVTSIGQLAFYHCAMSSIEIPSSVVEMGNDVFWLCDKLTKIVSRPTTPPVGDVFSGESIYSQATLFVPVESLEAYLANEEWGKFTHIVPFRGVGPGDINGDGNIAISDATNLIDLLLGGDELPAYADVNGDGEVSIKDATDLIDILLCGN